MKLLTAGFGTGAGPNMVLLCPSRKPGFGLENVLLSYSCHPPALPKIRQCLESSGRYDAWLQPGWVFGQFYNVRRDLDVEGVEFHLTSVPDGYQHQVGRKRVELSII